MPRRNEERLFWESFTKAYPIKGAALLPLAAMPVVGCGREGAPDRPLDRLDYASQSGDARRPKTAEKLHNDVTRLNGLLALRSKRDLAFNRPEYLDATVDAAITAPDQIATSSPAEPWTLDRIEDHIRAATSTTTSKLVLCSRLRARYTKRDNYLGGDNR